MSNRPMHPCAGPRCRGLADVGKKFCDACDTGRPASRHGSSIVDSKRWREYSKSFLAKHPVCCDPFKRHQGRIVQATVTGHKTAHRGDLALCFDPENHVPLCNGCNARQGTEFEGGFGNAVKPGSADLYKQGEWSKAGARGGRVE
jgi:5-methylcytosine-specific restriction enzyme A